VTLLLDTHAYVWAMSAPDRLSPAARRAIEDRRRTVLVSAATAWEMAIEHRAGR
jgi:PIN domain nuclease of toxin-antitoxin system